MALGNNPTIHRYTNAPTRIFLHYGECEVCLLKSNGLWNVYDHWEKKEIKICEDCLVHQEDKDIEMRKVADVL